MELQLIKKKWNEEFMDDTMKYSNKLDKVIEENFEKMVDDGLDSKSPNMRG